MCVLGAPFRKQAMARALAMHDTGQQQPDSHTRSMAFCESERQRGQTPLFLAIQSRALRNAVRLGRWDTDSVRHYCTVPHPSFPTAETACWCWCWFSGFGIPVPLRCASCWCCRQRELKEPLEPLLCWHHTHFQLTATLPLFSSGQEGTPCFVAQGPRSPEVRR